MNTGRLSEHELALSSLGKLQEDQQRKVDGLITYFDSRRESSERALRGLRESDAELLKQSQAREAEIQKTIARLPAR